MSMEALEKEVSELKRDVAHIKEMLAEEYELSDEAEEGLNKARKTPLSEYRELE